MKNIHELNSLAEVKQTNKTQAMRVCDFLQFNSSWGTFKLWVCLFQPFFFFFNCGSSHTSESIIFLIKIIKKFLKVRWAALDYGSISSVSVCCFTVTTFQIKSFFSPIPSVAQFPQIIALWCERMGFLTDTLVYWKKSSTTILFIFHLSLTWYKKENLRSLFLNASDC